MKRKAANAQVISIMTECGICGEVTTKRCYDDFSASYLCEDCRQLSNLKKIFKIYESLMNVMVDDKEFEDEYNELLNLSNSLKVLLKEEDD